MCVHACVLSVCLYVLLYGSLCLGACVAGIMDNPVPRTLWQHLVFTTQSCPVPTMLPERGPHDQRLGRVMGVKKAHQVWRLTAQAQVSSSSVVYHTGPH